MEILKIPKNSIGITKTLRFPSDIDEDLEALSEIKNQSFNKIAIYLVKFSLEKLDDEDKSFIKK